MNLNIMNQVSIQEWIFSPYLTCSAIFQPLEKGIINFLMKCQSSADVGDNYEHDKVIIRVFGPQLHRESECELMRILSEKSIIPPVHCR